MNMQKYTIHENTMFHLKFIFNLKINYFIIIISRQIDGRMSGFTSSNIEVENKAKNLIVFQTTAFSIIIILFIQNLTFHFFDFSLIINYS